MNIPFKIGIAVVGIAVVAGAAWLIKPAVTNTVVSESLEDILPSQETTLPPEEQKPEESSRPLVIPPDTETEPIKTPPKPSTTPPTTPPLQQPPEEPKEPTAPPTGPVTLKTGRFQGEAGHEGAGTATVIRVEGKTYLRLESDFAVSNAPDLLVHLGKDGAYSKEARIAALKGNIGGQNYEIPSDLDVSLYNEVWIWCRAFSVPVASADLL